MKIQLPLENWADLLPFVPRRQLVEIVKQLGDRQFAKILQFFLTEVGQITLGHLCIAAPRENDPNGGGPIVEVVKSYSYESGWGQMWPEIDLETNLPEGPMPTNVKDFKIIELSYFDMSVANFLQQFQQKQQQGNSILDNVNLKFSSYLTTDDNTIIPILARLMPMIGNINSMSIWNLHHMGFGREPNDAAFQLLMKMLTNARILEIDNICEFPWCDWLYAPRNDGKPPALCLSASFPDTKNLIEQIQKDFSKDIRLVSFFVCVRALGKGYVEWQDTCMHNGQTNEQLVVKTINHLPLYYGPPEKIALISRYPVGANPEWIEANEKEIVGGKFHEQNRRIRFESGMCKE